MLYENDVIDAVRLHLEKQDYSVHAFCHSHQRGHDIHAKHPKKKDLFIEAKGEGSARVGSLRYGRTFNKGQVNDHVGRAILRALHYRAGKNDSGVAFPDNDHHRNEVIPIRSILFKAGIRIFMVAGNKRVTEIQAEQGAAANP